MIDLIGDLGGVLEVFTFIFIVLVGSISKYSFNIKFFKKFYLAKSTEKNHLLKPKNEIVGRIKLVLTTIVFQ